MAFELKFTSINNKDDEELLNKYFINMFRQGFIVCNDTFLPIHYRDMAQDILNFEVRDDDIWICTFPKTGTTWVQEMIWCIANDLDFQGAKKNLTERFPYLEITSMVNYDKMVALNPGFKAPNHVMDSLNYVKDMPSPRFIKTHLPLHLTPLQLQQGTTKAKIVYVVRNVKDTCISYYYHHKVFEGCKASLEQFTGLFLNDAVIYAPFWRHVLDFWEKRNDLNLLFLKYEDLKKDLPSVVQKTADFLKKSLTEDQIFTLCEHLSFENMKNNRALNFDDIVEFNSKFKIVEGEGHFMRSGKVGDWKEKFSPELIQEFDKWAENNLKGTDLVL